MAVSAILVAYLMVFDTGGLLVELGGGPAAPCREAWGCYSAASEELRVAVEPLRDLGRAGFCGSGATGALTEIWFRLVADGRELVEPRRDRVLVRLAVGVEERRRIDRA